MPRTIEKTVYRFDELSERAKDKARDAMRADGDLWAWGGEWWDSAQAFSRIAPIDITEADYDRRHVNIRWIGGDERELSGLRAWKWLNNNEWFAWAEKQKQGACTMTGYCGDSPFGDAIAAYANNPLACPDLYQVFYEAAQAWVFEAADDLEYSYSDAAIDELIKFNEWEFDDEGNMA